MGLYRVAQCATWLFGSYHKLVRFFCWPTNKTSENDKVLKWCVKLLRQPTEPLGVFWITHTDTEWLIFVRRTHMCALSLGTLIESRRQLKTLYIAARDWPCFKIAPRAALYISCTCENKWPNANGCWLFADRPPSVDMYARRYSNDEWSPGESGIWMENVNRAEPPCVKIFAQVR